MFEIFDYRRKRFNLKPFVSINPQGIFRFNVACHRQYINKNLFANAYLDKELHRIGFQFVNDSSECSMTLHKSKEGLFLNGKMILDTLGIKINETTKFDLKEDSNIIYFTWDQPNVDK